MMTMTMMLELSYSRNVSGIQYTVTARVLLLLPRAQTHSRGAHPISTCQSCQYSGKEKHCHREPWLKVHNLCFGWLESEKSKRAPSAIVVAPGQGQALSSAQARVSVVCPKPEKPLESQVAVPRSSSSKSSSNRVCILDGVEATVASDSAWW